jgi:hypothetical protein
MNRERRHTERRKAVRMKRRAFLGAGLAGMAVMVARGSRSAGATAQAASPPATVKAPRLRAGDTIGLVNPSA